jgi:hypothetical protein
MRRTELLPLLRVRRVLDPERISGRRYRGEEKRVSVVESR